MTASVPARPISEVGAHFTPGRFLALVALILFVLHPALVVLAQTWYHPWRACVNDQPTTLWRANRAYQALEVPAGSSRVRVVYEDRAFRLGVLLSMTGLLICVAGLAVSRFRRGAPNEP
ncbi:MAG: YfhO family protein [Verrucomicrobia bacterium]|nr:YfhO family protein [Verrucomicrobiota bacterium]